LNCSANEADFRFCHRGRWLSFRMWSYGDDSGHAISRVTAHVKGAQQRG
jgi:hypothetical protein